MENQTKYTRISGTILNFKDGTRFQTDAHFSSQTIDPEKRKIKIITYLKEHRIETYLNLEGEAALDYTSVTDDPKIPIIKGKFLNSNYEESILTSSLPDKNIAITGAITKLNDSSAVSIKTLVDSSSGQVMALVQELVELISESEFNVATKKM